MGKLIQMGNYRDDTQITWIPHNYPPLHTAVSKHCPGCKKKHLMYPVFDEDTNQIGWWWCYNHNEPISISE